MALSTSIPKGTLEDIPSRWIFERYLKLDSQLEGQSIRFRSVFNEKDDNPSMFIFPSKKHSGDYRFKCHSTGKYGDGYDLMSTLWGVTVSEASKRIKNDWESNPDAAEEVKHRVIHDYGWKLKSYQLRNWDMQDAQFWKPYNIGQLLLQEYIIYPLDWYELCQADRPGFIVRKPNLYGYFSKAGVLHKIYQPYNRKNKFVKVAQNEPFIQGLDQLKGYPVLAICSGMKDMLALQSLQLQIDTIAPDSENSPLPEWLITQLMQQYVRIVVILDNDPTGLKNMIKYEQEYGLPYYVFDLAKDIALGVKDVGIEPSRVNLVQGLNTLFSQLPRLNPPREEPSLPVIRMAVTPQVA